MIISCLTGGLGNQMFQYAFGRYLAYKHKTQLKLHFINALYNTQRDYELDVFNIKATLASKQDLNNFKIVTNKVSNRILYLLDERLGLQFNKNIVTEKYPYIFNSQYFNIPNNSYIQGFFNDKRYFILIESIIRKEFTLKHLLDRLNLIIINQMKKINSVSIHVRRGDYLTKNNKGAFVGIDYYIKAIKKINKLVKNPYFYIFSDDLDWCRMQISPLLINFKTINYNFGKNAYRDMVLMSHCKHNIIANSTFSWWGGWLNKNKNKIIIEPYLNKLKKYDAKTNF